MHIFFHRGFLYTKKISEKIFILYKAALFACIIFNEFVDDREILVA